MFFHANASTKVLDHLSANMETGLTASEVSVLQQQYGENKLAEKKKKSIVQKFLLQFTDFMVIILLIAAVISFVLAFTSHEGDLLEPFIILAIVVVNAIIGVVQENNAEKALEALQKMSAPFAKVKRDNTVTKIPAIELVPGDILFLEAGDSVPADARLLEGASLKAEESALTGESVPVEKDARVTVTEKAPLGDRINMVYSGCSISYGRATAVVTSIGMDTEMGKIAGLLNAQEDGSTPLQHKLAKLGKYLGIIALAVCAVIFVLGIIQQESILTMFMTSVSLAVAAIPEGLPAVVTIVLAMGVQKMVKKNAIIRRLPAVETLGSASVICSDKTGTLTQNKMTVLKVYADGEENVDIGTSPTEKQKYILAMGSLCNDAVIETVDGQRKENGDPTETAIIHALMDTGIGKNELEENSPRVGEIPFDSDRKLMTTVHMIDGKPVAIVKGAFDVMLSRCAAGDLDKAKEINIYFAENALRVLAVGYKVLEKVPEDCTSGELENGLVFMGLIGMIDPPREEAKEAISVCKRAGIKTVMITGDHVITATAIAKELGILENENEALSGVQLNSISDEELTKDIRKYSVYARVSPEDKIRIVKAWQANGEVVAMTGDGVNDAPALKAADIGCAMGITGTDVAKGSADMVLTDDNFATIVSAVKEGRGIYSNIKKVVSFLLSSNLGEVLVVFVAMLLNWGSPLMAMQLLLVNLVSDGFPALALGVEAVEDDEMDRKPIRKNESIFAHGLGLHIALQGLMIGGITLVAYYIGRFVSISGAVASVDAGQTMAFLVLALSQLVHSLNCRSRKSLFKVGFFTNKKLWYANFVSLAIVLIIALIPPLAAAFNLIALSGMQWGMVVGLSIVPLVLVEIVKAFGSLAKKKQ